MVWITCSLKRVVKGLFKSVHNLTDCLYPVIKNLYADTVVMVSFSMIVFDEYENNEDCILWSFHSKVLKADEHHLKFLHTHSIWVFCPARSTCPNYNIREFLFEKMAFHPSSWVPNAFRNQFKSMFLLFFPLISLSSLHHLPFPVLVKKTVVWMCMCMCAKMQRTLASLGVVSDQ